MLSSSLASPYFSHLDTQSILQYRQSYRQYRLGHWRGARGEIEEVVTKQKSLNSCSASNTTKKRKREEKEKEGGIKRKPSLTNFEEDFDSFDEFEDFSFCNENGNTNGNENNYEKDTKAFQLLSKWRIHYRRFRQGHARGAEGDLQIIANRLTMAHLSYLPVCQLKELMVSEQKKKEEETEEKGEEEEKTEKKRKKTLNLHVHFGAGKLGLGLIVPAIVKSNQPFVILQKYSDPWHNLIPKEEKENENGKAKDYVYLKINSKLLCRLRLFKPNENKIEDLLHTNSHEYLGWFACGVGERIEEEIIKKADSYSCALGMGISSFLFPKLNKLPHKDNEERPVLYACENDHKSVEDLAKKLDGKADVVTCMVDRICASRIISSYLIEISAEPYEGEIVVLNLPQRSIPPYCPFKGSNVQIPQLNSEAKYFSQRKILIVNGMHTTLAFMTLCKHAKTLPPQSYDLVNPIICSEKEKRQIWGWAVARCLLLLFQHDLDIIKAAHGVKSDEEVIDILLSYAQNTLRRFSTIDDTTGRVLSGGIANRYETRLKNVQEFVDAAGPTSMPIGNLLLKKAGIGACELGFIIFSLVEKAKKFVETPAGGKANEDGVAKTEKEVTEKQVEFTEKNKSDNTEKVQEEKIPVSVLGVPNPMQLFKNGYQNLASNLVQEQNV